MNTQCELYQKELAAYLYGELPEEMSRAMESHLQTCADCRREMNDMKKVFNGADTLNPDMSAAMEKVDWDGLPDRIADRVLGRGSSAHAPGRAGFRGALPAPRMRPLYAALFMGIVGFGMFHYALAAGWSEAEARNGLLLLMVPMGLLLRRRRQLSR